MSTAEWVLFWTAMALGLVATFYAVKFMWHYRKVDWQASPWGTHVMRFSLIVALLFGLTVLLSVAALFGFSHALTALVLTNLLYGWAAWELRHRGRLEREAQRRLQRSRPTARPYVRHEDVNDA